MSYESLTNFQQNLVKLGVTVGAMVDDHVDLANIDWVDKRRIQT